MTRWWWFSFSSEETGFLGGGICDGETFTEAHANTHRRGMNPGGSVKAREMELCAGPEDMLPYRPYRLYSKAEMEEIDGAEKF